MKKKTIIVENNFDVNFNKFKGANIFCGAEEACL